MENNELAVIRHSQIEAFRTSGQTASEWCKENDIRISTLRYWITKINQRNKQVTQGFIAFTPSASEPSAIVVKIGNYGIEVNVFCNKRCDKCKILRWDNNGWWLYYRKLSKGVFRWRFDKEKQVLEVCERQFHWLLDGMSIDQPTAVNIYGTKSSVVLTSSFGYT